MPPTGPFTICRYGLSSDDSDAVTYVTFCYGYATAEQALNALPTVAEAEALPIEDLCVVRPYTAQEIRASAPSQ